MRGFDLTAYMRQHGIIKIADIGEGQFSVWMRGGRCGTGKTVGQALENARAQFGAAA